MGSLIPTIAVTFSLVAPILLLLLVINVIGEHRRLREAGFPRPWLIVGRRLLAFLPPTTAGIEDLTGRRAWVSWDLRWLTAGQTMSVVRSVDASTGTLVLELDQPIVVHAAGNLPEVELKVVEFVPRASGTPNYLRRAVPGLLRPEVSPGFVATASAVVYPADADA